MNQTHAPLAASGPGGQKLVAGLLLLENASEFIPVQPALVERALDPMWYPRLNDHVEANSAFVGLLRTAGYFILNAEQVDEAINSQPPEGLLSFPPLPFKRVWIETHRVERGVDVPSVYTRYVREETEVYGVKMPEESVEILGVGLVEVVRGREWDVYVPHRRQGVGRPRINVGVYRITPTTIVMPKMDWLNADKALTTLLTMAVNGAHLITAKNVPHREYALPRAQRKGMQRNFQFAPRIPKLYYVDLGASGEGEDDTGRTREYHVRWLVMGHWRHIAHGDDLCTCYDHRYSPRVATYINPYVKGPIGAPWKGRPVHRQEVA